MAVFVEKGNNFFQKILYIYFILCYYYIKLNALGGTEYDKETDGRRNLTEQHL